MEWSLIMNRMLRIDSVKELTSLSKSSIYRLVKLGNFPAPLKLSERAVGWPENIILLWISSKLSQPLHK